MRVFVAGASGAIGEPLIAELLRQGHSVVGMTTSEARAKNLQGQGAEAMIPLLSLSGLMDSPISQTSRSPSFLLRMSTMWRRLRSS